MIGWNAFRVMFFTDVQVSPKVCGIVANLLLISSAAANIAPLIISAVMSPSDDISFSSPFDLPVKSAIASASIGAFSMMLLNSSPCNFPDAIA